MLQGDYRMISIQKHKYDMSVTRNDVCDRKKKPPHAESVHTAVRAREIAIASYSYSCQLLI